eukprot:scpid102070/ scgid14461/ 
MEERHTGSNIADRLKEICTSWNIVDKIAGIVRDNAANMVAAGDMLEIDLSWKHVGCVEHTLQLFVKEGLKEPAIVTLVSVARKMVGHIQPLCASVHQVA